MRLLLILFIINNIFSQTILYFNGNNAMNYLEQQCKIGPRYPGSVGHLEAIDLYQGHLNKYSEDVILFEHHAIHPHSLDSIKLTNIFSRFNSNSNFRIFFAMIKLRNLCPL